MRRSILETGSPALSLTRSIEDEAEDLTAQLPRNLSRHRTEGESGRQFSEELLAETDADVDVGDRTPGEY
ncbi:hypothetical protein CP556_08200 [Natrinema sp. CBA1119]|uniref:hypothetical protein n=1 Tax=Natrinema sp. CBA1119 TaxID=1608465 RepID=UPI000BF5E9E6|nr:hypothetical protein [Natrinema sp. CBA1119]PGF16100.1 hypothetical protein CP556_08200 [Natrinema sp. CBA1119]